MKNDEARLSSLLDTLKFDSRGLVPAVTQDAESGRVLMLAYMNRQAVEATLRTGRVHYWSRSRNELWLKGESSGNYQHLVEMRVDCDEDALLVRANQTGVACHTGERSCFYRRWDEVPAPASQTGLEGAGGDNSSGG